MKQRHALLLVIVTNVFLLLFSYSPLAAATCTRWIGKAVSVEGGVQVRRSGESAWQAVRLNDVFCAGDAIRVQERSRAAVLLMNESTLRLDQNTSIVFSKPEEEKTAVIDLIIGIVHFFSRTPRSLKVATPFVNGNVEGTEFLVSVGKDKALLSVFEGRVVASNEAGSVTLASGQSAEAKKGEPPVLAVLVRPRDSVQWALYYPLISYAPSGPRAEWQRRVASLLSVGRVDEAGKEIEGALAKSPDDSDALAFLSIISLVNNDKEKALSLARRAVEADSRSSSARMALSYALQARFDLKGARESVEEAIRIEPQNALAWARLADLWMSMGNLDESLKAAQKAVALNPDLSRTWSVLGFAYLTQVKTKAAREAFEKAIELDKGDPLPRLGLGLAKIRDGELHAGGIEIEISAGLDPNNSLIRSYLGKTYYEEKREEKSSNQYGIAKELDPLDPTPFFYDAILKQSMNRPVEALEDLQKAIDLNDNRAVYRSRLLLDADLAARSASLARIYSDLGFQQLALVEGWQSVNTDPANFSAHRFLADSYAALPRHEVARVSELLQSQLLQPININPVQPHLGESALFILEGAGPSDLSFNEFNPLFNRNRLSLQLSGVVGGNSTWGDEVVASGVYDKYSLSAGQFHYQTSGFRENNDQRQDIYNVFAQVSITPQTSVQAEYRHREVHEGDLSLLFNPEAFNPTFRENDKTDLVRVGAHHSFSPNSDLLVSGLYQHQDIDQPDLAKIDSTGYGAEAQHLYRAGLLKMITGIGYFTTRQDTTAELIPTESADTDHTNLYLYANVNYPKQVVWTLGASGDFFRSDFLDLKKDQFNPKFGFIWNLFPGTTLRAAVFRTLKRTLLNDQTLEPTQVAGFNQFFDDGPGTSAWLYGIGIDQKFTKGLFAGAEFSKRDLTVPGQAVDQTTGTVTFADFDLHELVGRAYVNWAPRSWLALSTAYQYEKFKRPEDFASADFMSDLQTHRLSFGINFYHPSGLYALLKPIYVYQHGDFIGPFGTEPGSDHFWVFDAAIGYRLPKRYGIFTIEAKNLFNQKFNFQDTDPANPGISPKQLILAKLTLSF